MNRVDSGTGAVRLSTDTPALESANGAGPASSTTTAGSGPRSTDRNDEYRRTPGSERSTINADVAPPTSGLRQPAPTTTVGQPPAPIEVELGEHRLDKLTFWQKLLDTLLEVVTFSLAKTKTYNHTIDEAGWRSVGREMAAAGSYELKSFMETNGEAVMLDLLRTRLSQINPGVHPRTIAAVATQIYTGMAAGVAELPPQPEVPPDGGDPTPRPTYGYTLGPVAPDSLEESFDRVWGNNDGSFGELEASMHWAAYSMNLLYDASIRLYSTPTRPGGGGGTFIRIDENDFGPNFLDQLAAGGARITLEAQMGIMLEIAARPYLTKLNGAEPTRAQLLAFVAQTLAQRHVPIDDYLTVIRTQNSDNPALGSREARAALEAFTQRASEIGWTPPSASVAPPQ